jgi:O-acetylserine/cysteine efflux transporter
MTRTELIDRRGALGALTAAGLLWGLSVPLSKLALDWLDPAWLSALRFLIAAPVLLVLARRALPGALDARVAGWGVVGFGGVILLQNFGIARTSVSHAALIIGVVPALVAIVAVARGTGTAGPLAWTGYAVALGGVGLVAGSGGEASLLGDLLVLASAALTALYIEAQSRILRGRDAAAVTAVQMTAAAVVLTPIALALEGVPAGAGASAATLGALGALVVVGTLLPFVLYATGQARVPAELAGAFVNLEPLVGALVGAVAFHDVFGPLQTAGAAGILGGILLALVPSDAPRWRPRRRGGLAVGAC